MGIVSSWCKKAESEAESKLIEAVADVCQRVLIVEWNKMKHDLNDGRSFKEIFNEELFMDMSKQVVDVCIADFRDCGDACVKKDG